MAMTSYCLMHSSGQGPEGWALVVDELERRGHRVLTPAFDLDRSNEGLAWHGGSTVDALERSGFEPSDTVCVAHSASGMYLPLVVEAWQPRQMGFLAAVVPQPGRSVMDQLRADPSMFNPDWLGKDPREDGVAEEFVFHDCPPQRLEWAMSTRVFFHAKQAMVEPCPLTEWPAVPAFYVVCAEDRTLTPTWQRKAAREWLGVEPYELPGGHAPNVSRPEALADVLERAAA
jgi:pimeloyl-ACP methyl ester carboxylesterase